MKIGVVSDIHLRAEMPYNDLVDREEEREKILNFIVETFKVCDAVVLNGDSLHSRNNSSAVLARFVCFLEQLGNKPIYIVAGNHELNGNGTSALDFLRELTGKDNWHIYSNAISYLQMDPRTKAVFLPYFHRTMLGVENVEEWGKKLTQLLEEAKGKILFVHHAISGCGTSNWDSTDGLGEPLLDKELLESKFDMVIAGHIHNAGDYGKTHVVGSVFNSEINETGKTVAVIDTEDLTFTRVPLPGRWILGLTDPKIEDVTKYEGQSCIFKIVVTDSRPPAEIEAIKSALEKHGPVMVVEKPAGRREKAHIEEGVESLSMESLITMYAQSKKVPSEPLFRAWELLRE